MSGNVWRIEAFRVLYWMHFVAAVLIPFFTDWAGLTLTKIMVLNAWFFAWNFLLEIPTGAVADFFGRKWSLALGAVVTAAACLLYVSVPRFGVFLIAEMVFATGNCLVSGADEALLYDSLVATGRVGEASRRIARLSAAQLVGIVTGALAGSVIAGQWGVRAPLGCQAVPIGLAAVLATTLVEPAAPIARDRVAYRTLLFAGLRRLRTDHRLRVVVADMVLGNVFVWTLIWLYQPLLARAGVSRAWFGAIHATICIAQITVLRSIDRLVPVAGGRARYLRFAVTLSGAAMLGLAWPLSSAATIALLLVAMGFGLSRLPIASTAINASVESDVRATMLSTVSMVRMLAICLVNPIAGALADRSLGTALAVLGAATLLVAVASPVGERHLSG